MPMIAKGVSYHNVPSNGGNLSTIAGVQNPLPVQILNMVQDVNGQIVIPNVSTHAKIILKMNGFTLSNSTGNEAIIHNSTTTLDIQGIGGLIQSGAVGAISAINRIENTGGLISNNVNFSPPYYDTQDWAGWFGLRSSANIRAGMTSGKDAFNGLQYVLGGWTSAGAGGPDGSRRSHTYTVSQPGNVYFRVCSSGAIGADHNFGGAAGGSAWGIFNGQFNDTISMSIGGGNREDTWAGGGPGGQWSRLIFRRGGGEIARITCNAGGGNSNGSNGSPGSVSTSGTGNFSLLQTNNGEAGTSVGGPSGQNRGGSRNGGRGHFYRFGNFAAQNAYGGRYLPNDLTWRPSNGDFGSGTQSHSDRPRCCTWNNVPPGAGFIWQDPVVQTQGGAPVQRVPAFGGTGVTLTANGTPTSGIDLTDFLATNGVHSIIYVPYTIEYFILAGGGGGGGAQGGGGGAGGLIANQSRSMIPNQSLAIAIGGGGGAGVGSYGIGSKGGNSSIATVGTAIGGGGGAGSNSSSPFQPQAGISGGSGGGSSANSSAIISGTAGQGNSGGRGNSTATGAGGGGGGRGGAGGNGNVNNNGGTGGAGLNQFGTVYAGGGGGGVGDQSGGKRGGAGGSGIGGAGGTLWTSNGNNAVANRGSGGGGGGVFSSRGGNGSSGIVVIRYLGPQQGIGGTVSSSGGYTYHVFTSSGTYTA